MIEYRKRCKMPEKKCKLCKIPLRRIKGNHKLPDYLGGGRQDYLACSECGELTALPIVGGHKPAKAKAEGHKLVLEYSLKSNVKAHCSCGKWTYACAGKTTTPQMWKSFYKHSGVK